MVNEIVSGDDDEWYKNNSPPDEWISMIYEIPFFKEKKTHDRTIEDRTNLKQ